MSVSLCSSALHFNCYIGSPETPELKRARSRKVTGFYHEVTDRKGHSLRKILVTYN
jgi:hypothetical protein